MKTTKNDAFWDELTSQTDEKEYARISRKMEIASFLYNTLKAKGISQKQFAERMGKKPSEISKWLSGTHNFTLETLSDIEQVLGIRVFNVNEQPVVDKLSMKTVNGYISKKRSSSYTYIETEEILK